MAIFFLSPFVVFHVSFSYLEYIQLLKNFLLVWMENFEELLNFLLLLNWHSFHEYLDRWTMAYECRQIINYQLPISFTFICLTVHKGQEWKSDVLGTCFIGEIFFWTFVKSWRLSNLEGRWKTQFDSQRQHFYFLFFQLLRNCHEVYINFVRTTTHWQCPHPSSLLSFSPPSQFFFSGVYFEVITATKANVTETSQVSIHRMISEARRSFWTIDSLNLY